MPNEDSVTWINPRARIISALGLPPNASDEELLAKLEADTELHRATLAELESFAKRAALVTSASDLRKLHTDVARAFDALNEQVADGPESLFRETLLAFGILRDSLASLTKLL
ncbi:MAG: hypothetical protein ACR2HH_01830 [Chthoniobacterales bacterium]